jgi:hypothetical protein
VTAYGYYSAKFPSEKNEKLLSHATKYSLAVAGNLILFGLAYTVKVT